MLGVNDTKLALICPRATLLKQKFPLSQFYCFVKQNTAPVKTCENFCGLYGMIGEGRVDQLERHHSNGLRSVSPRGIIHDLMVNTDLPVEEVMQRDQTSCHQPVGREIVHLTR